MERESGFVDQSLLDNPSMLYENSFSSIKDINTSTLNTRSTLKHPSGIGLSNAGTQDSNVNEKIYFSWTRGTLVEGDDHTSMTDTGLSDDPFGNVAGQYMSSHNKVRLRSESTTLRTIKPYEEDEGTEFIGVLSAYEKKLSTPFSKQQSMRSQSLSSRGNSRGTVYIPPSILGALERPKSCAVYDSGVYNGWLANTRQAAYDVDVGASKSAGGRISANKGTSASPMKGLVLPSSHSGAVPKRAVSVGGGEATEFFTPLLPLDTIDVEIYQYKHVVQTTLMSKVRVFAKIRISSSTQFREFKRILMDIDLQHNFSAVIPSDVMTLYFNDHLKSWKVMKTALDFDHAVLIANELRIPLKVMYAYMKNRDIIDNMRSQYSRNNRDEGQSSESNRMTPKTVALLYDDSALFGDEESSNSYSESNIKSQASVESKNVYKSKNHNYSPSILLIPPGPRSSSPDHTVMSKFKDMAVKPNFKKQEQLALFLQQKILKTKW